MINCDGSKCSAAYMLLHMTPAHPDVIYAFMMIIYNPVEGLHNKHHVKIHFGDDT